MDIYWIGRAFIEEPEITLVQYNTFFDKSDEVISFSRANSIFKENAVGESRGYIVPCDQLNKEAIDQIKKQFLEGKSNGVLILDNQNLHWAWYPQFFTRTGNVSIMSINKKKLEKVLSDMLDLGCYCGQVKEE